MGSTFHCARCGVELPFADPDGIKVVNSSHNRDLITYFHYATTCTATPDADREIYARMAKVAPVLLAEAERRFGN